MRGFGVVTLIPSSLFKAGSVHYNVRTRVLDLKLNNKWYSYPNISPRKYARFLAGRATCVTDDPTGRGRWNKGKHPSMGAFYTQFIKVGGIKGFRLGRVVKARTVKQFRKAKLRRRGGRI